MKILKNCLYILFILIFTFFIVPAEAAPKRIISLTPAGTEILYALGQEKNLIANTTFCDYPPEAQKKPKVGGFASMNYEYFISKKADLVVIQDLHAQFIPQLEKLKIPFVTLRQETIEEVCDSIMTLGKATDSEKRAKELVTSIEKDIEYVSEKVKNSPRPKILLCISREFTGDKINIFFAAGNASFYNDMIKKGGGVNALKKQKITYPQISQEGLMMINPDVIIELIGDIDSGHSLTKGFAGMTNDLLKQQWLNGVQVKAVRDNHVHILNGSIYLRPGPRVGQALLGFARALHPEINW